MPNITIAFLSEKDNFSRCEIHFVRYTYLFQFYLSKTTCKTAEVNSEPIHFLTFTNICKTFSSLDSMTCSCQCSDHLQLLPGHWQAERYWMSWDLQKLISLENNPNNTRNNMKSQIQNKKNRGSISFSNY